MIKKKKTKLNKKKVKLTDLGAAATGNPTAELTPNQAPPRIIKPTAEAAPNQAPPRITKPGSFSLDKFKSKRSTGRAC